ncbi:bifunctional NADH dehydrogenase FAD-containing subunit/selenide, water dikinase SelD, partial [Escherichia coli]|nr:bifunctional NADH dehydrogenase FAD-containing subunit/selenide, water dikinase SelD [Escherichia coli]
TMLRASGLGADLALGAVPLMPGALELAQEGVRSTAFEANAALGRDLIGAEPGDPRTALAFDPQTAGGLLAAVPVDQAQGLVERLQQGGDQAAVIGHLAPGAPRITLR